MAGRLHDWIEALPEDGRYVFTRAETSTVTDASEAAIKMTLYRLKRSGAIVSPRRDFFVVVPREYRSAGCPPATWFINDLMRHLGRRYYVALLSAAALHGAGHQQPMAFQVIADAAERDIEVGRVRIEFHVSNRFEGAATQSMQTETGTMLVATPETTAFDLVRFPAAAGYWSNIATVVAELSEKLDPKALAAGAARASRSDVQRLGWLLDFVEESALADSVAKTLAGKRLLPTPLTAARDATDAPLDPRWRVLVNDDVEPDL
jgi:predicted transcriptional regulator of viral defense system